MQWGGHSGPATKKREAVAQHEQGKSFSNGAEDDLFSKPTIEDIWHMPRSSREDMQQGYNHGAGYSQSSATPTPYKPYNGDADTLLGQAERSDRPLVRRQSTVRFGGASAITTSPGGVKGESKPPVHTDMKRRLSRPGLRMQESPFADDARTVRLALHVHSLSGIDAASSSFSVSFTLHVVWEKKSATMPEIRLLNAMAVERIDSEVQTSPSAVMCHADIFFRARLAAVLDLAWYPFDQQCQTLAVRVQERCQLRPPDGAFAVVDRTATPGGAWRSLASFVSLEYVRGLSSHASSHWPEARFTLRLQRRRTTLTWLCRAPLSLMAMAALGELGGDGETRAAVRLQTLLLLLLALLALRCALTAPYGHNTTLVASASTVDACHLLGCVSFVGLAHLQAEMLPWAALPASARTIAIAANAAAWVLAHALVATLLARHSPSVDEAAPSADAG